MVFSLRVAFAAAFIGSAALASAPARAGNEIASATLYFENDAFAFTERSDRWYTHGTKLIWTYRDPGAEGLQGPYGLLAAIPRWMLWRGERAATGPMMLAGHAGQNIYTPQELFKTEFEPRDRPYGGWLYTGAIAQQSIGRWSETAEFKLGLIGPGSLARQAQGLTHFVLGGKRTDGWDNQLRSRLGMEFGYLGRYLLEPWAGSIGLIPHAGATVGNLRALAHVGASLVFGRRLQQATLHGSGEGIGDTLTPFPQPPAGSGDWTDSLYAFVGFDTAWVGTNRFIDGETLAGSPRVTLRHRVHQVTVGIGMDLPRSWYGRGARFGYAYMTRSAEFDSPGFTPSPRQNFGTFWVSARF